MKILPTLKPGDSIEIIAPASRCTDTRLTSLIELLESWGLHCNVPADIFARDLFCANTDELRGRHLKNALLNPDSKAIIAARGGYGSARLIPQLADIYPQTTKIFVGMSDCTALHLYFQQQWQWPTVHGALATDKFSPSCISALKAILFGEVRQVNFSDISPLNSLAEKNHIVEASVIGGNLSMIQAGIHTAWQMDSRGKIILLEETGERSYRIDRMLEHLRQAGLFKEAAAIVLGDFLGGLEPDGSSLVAATLQRFAQSCEIPVVQIRGIGHDYLNYPIPLGSPATLKFGKDSSLICVR